MTALDARTIAADIMCGNARSITVGEVWAHIGQAYDTAEIDASIADEVAELIAKTGIDLIWPDGTANTELDAARVEVERLKAELVQARAEGRREAAADIERMPINLGDTGWKHLEDKAVEADYPAEWVRRRRTRDDFTTATIGAAYQYGYRQAAKVARGEVAR